MRKTTFLILFLFVNLCFCQTKMDSVAAINKAVEIQQRVDKKGNSNTVNEIKAAVSELTDLIPNFKSNRALADLKYLRGMTIYSFFRFSFVGNNLTKTEKIDVCKNTIADLEFAEKHGYEDDDSVYIVLKQARKELELLR